MRRDAYTIKIFNVKGTYTYAVSRNDTVRERARWDKVLKSSLSNGREGGTRALHNTFPPEFKVGSTGFHRPIRRRVELKPDDQRQRLFARAFLPCASLTYDPASRNLPSLVYVYTRNILKVAHSPDRGTILSMHFEFASRLSREKFSRAQLCLLLLHSFLRFIHAVSNLNLTYFKLKFTREKT